MTHAAPADDAWSACPAGLLAGRARRDRRLRLARRAAAIGGSGVALVALALGLSAFFRGGDSTEFDYGGITCTAVRREAPTYLAGRSTPEVAERMRVHLEQCDHCREFLRGLTGAAAAPACDCPFCRVARREQKGASERGAGPERSRQVVAAADGRP